MSRFTDATFTYTGKTRNGRSVIRLCTPLIYEVGFLGSGWVVAAPAGFECDGPSVPFWALPFFPVGAVARATIVHDILRATPKMPKLLGDVIFLEAMSVERTPVLWRLLAFAAVMVNFSRDRS